MQFRQSNKHDDRRRRVLSDLILGADRFGPARQRRGPDGGPSRRSKFYGDGDFLVEQARLTDLIPRRPMVLVLLALAGLAIIAALEMLHAWSAPGSDRLPIPAFDLSQRAGLATWCSSIVLALAGILAVMVYTVRRNRIDDYRGHYRVGLWAAMCWFLLSAGQTAGLHEAFSQTMIRLTGTPLVGDGSLWSIIAYGFLLGGVGTRLVVDMRHCRLSVATLVSGVACYGAAAVALCEDFSFSGTTGSVMFCQGAVLVGNLLFVLAMAIHARYVLLDAEGLVEHSDDPAEAEDRSNSSHNVTVHPPHSLLHPGTVPMAAPAPPTTTPAVASPASAVPPSGAQPARKLTKQERKVMQERLAQLHGQREAG
jgi:hypothetical protein